MRGRAGRAPVLMKMVSAVNVRVPPAVSLYLDDVGTGEVRFAENELDVLGIFQATLRLLRGSRPRLPACAGGLAPCQRRQSRSECHSRRRAGPSKRSRAGDHGLRRCAAYIDTGAADMLPFDDGGPATGAAQVEGQRFSRLAHANNNRVKAFQCHRIPSRKVDKARADRKGSRRAARVFLEIAA